MPFLSETTGGLQEREMLSGLRANPVKPRGAAVGAVNIETLCHTTITYRAVNLEDDQAHIVWPKATWK